MEPKHMLIITEQAGWIILDTPRSQTQGAIRRRAEPVGKMLYAYDIIPFAGVPYACLVPLDSAKPEWGRVSEAGGVLFKSDGSFREHVDGVRTYVKVVPLGSNEGDALAAALHDVADAIRTLGKQ